MAEETKSKEWQPDFKIEENISEPSTISRGLSNLDVREMRVGAGVDNPRILKRGSIIRARFETHQQEDEGIKIYKGVPATVYGNTGFYLPTTNNEPAAPYDGVPWTNPDNAETIDGLVATATQDTSKYQVWRGFTGLQDNIPATATILGIAVRCYAKADATDRYLDIFLTKDGVSPVVPGYKRSEKLDTSLAYVSVGGGEDLWGTTWSRSDFGSSFGVIISGSHGTTPSTTYSIDYIQVNVYYKREFTDDTGENLTDSFMAFWSKVGNVLLYLKKSTIDLWIEKANLVLKGAIRIEPETTYTGSTSYFFPTAYYEPGNELVNREWTNPEYAYTDNAQYAVAGSPFPKFQLWNSFNGLADAIPTGATITGIEMGVDATCNGGTGEIDMYIVKNGLYYTGPSRSTDTLSDGSFKYVSCGGSADLWGGSWTPANFGTEFGIILSGPSVETWVNYIKTRVFYTTTDNSMIKGGLVPAVHYTPDLGSSGSAFNRVYAKRIIADYYDQYYMPGNFLANSNDTETSSTSTSYEKKKETLMGRGGTIMIKLDLKSDTSDGTAYARIYRNTVAVGTEWYSVSDVYKNFSEVIGGWSAGDNVQIYLKKSGGTPYIQNFRIYTVDRDYMENTLT